MLQPGDTIVAVSGMPVTYSHEIFSAIQQKKVLAVVQKMPWQVQPAPISLEKATDTFFAGVHADELNSLINSIGTQDFIAQKGDFRLLRPIVPKTRSELVALQENKAEIEQAILEEKAQIEAIDDPDRKQEVLQLLEAREKQFLLGLPYVADMAVQYNPNPFVLFSSIIQEIYGTLGALVTGNLSPKWLSGPLGIVQVMKTQWTLGLKEALFWLATISINLGFLNLLPLPVLDGGYICLSLFEMVTRRRVKAKTIEKIVIPFAVLLISFLVYLTYHDVVRIVSGLFS